MRHVLINLEGEIMEKYISLAKDLKMLNVNVISPAEICFDIRTLLKCTQLQKREGRVTHYSVLTSIRLLETLGFRLMF